MALRENSRMFFLLICAMIFTFLFMFLAWFPLKMEKIEKGERNKTLTLLAPPWTEVGEAIMFKVIDSKGNPVENATIAIGNERLSTNKNGEVNFTFSEAGDYEIYAFKEGYTALPSIIYQNNGEAETLVAYIAEEGDRVIRPSSCEEPPCWGIKDGAIIVRKLRMCLFPPIWISENSSLVWRDYAIELDFKIISGSEGGFDVSFRHGRFGSYAVGLNYPLKHFLLEKKVGRKDYFPPNTSRQPEKTIHILTRDVEVGNRWHHLKVSIEGTKRPRITVDYDGKRIIDYQDEINVPLISEGTFMLCTCCEDTDIEIMFDNITVKLLQPNESITVKAIRVYPKGNEKIKYRILKAAITEPGKRHYGDEKTLGANSVEYRQDFYINPETHEIFTQPIDDIRERVIQYLHSRGIKVWFNPVFWGGDGSIKLEGVPIKNQEEKKELLRKIESYLIERAKFAEKNKVEFLFVGEIPANFYLNPNGSEYIDPVVRKWFEELPWKLKKYYSGKIVMIDPPVECHTPPGEVALKCEYPGNFSGYDYMSIVIGWDFNVGGDYEIHKLDVKEKLRAVLEKAREYGKKAIVLYAADLNEKFVKEEMEKGLEVDEIRAKIFKINFEETMKHLDEIDGIFPHPVWEGVGVKIYRIYNVRLGTQHEKALLFAYQGPAVERLIKEYFTVK